MSPTATIAAGRSRVLVLAAFAGALMLAGTPDAVGLLRNRGVLRDRARRLGRVLLTRTDER